MPIRKYGYSPKSANHIFRALRSAHLEPAALTNEEALALKAHCKEMVARVQNKIDAEERRGRHRIAQRYQRELWEGLAARLVAAWEASKKSEQRLPRHLRPLGPPKFDQIWALADRLKNPHAPSQAIRRTRRKPRGGYREYYVFNKFGIAKQKLFVNAIKPFASFHPSQFTLRRGRPAACESILRTMEEPWLRSATVFQFDVTDFYPSVSHRWLEDELPAPKAIIRNTLLMDGWLLVNGGMGVSMVQRHCGVPAGSAAASYVAEMVMADILDSASGQLSGIVGLHTYSDNVEGFKLPNTDANAMMERVTRVFAAHGAGPFRITWSGPAPLSRPFHFLGYWFAKEPGKKARAYLPDYIWQQKEMEFMTGIADAETPQHMLGVFNRLRSYCSAFKLALETRPLLRRVAQFMSAELRYRRRLRTTRQPLKVRDE